jgi:hypothetical protein
LAVHGQGLRYTFFGFYRRRLLGVRTESPGAHKGKAKEDARYTIPFHALKLEKDFGVACHAWFYLSAGGFAPAFNGTANRQILKSKLPALPY